MAKRRRSSRRLHGAASVAKNAPRACKVRLSHCMTGHKSRASKSTCMKSYWRCARSR